MRKIFALLLVLVLLAACAAPVVMEETATEQTTTTTEWTSPETQPTVLPTSFRGAPEVYWPVLQELYRIVHDGFNWGEREADPTLTFDPTMILGDTFGYAIADINGDGVQELILLQDGSWDGPPILLKLYTLYNGEPVLLNFAHRRGYVIIAENGAIYSGFTTGAGSFNRMSHVLESNRQRLTEVYFYDIYWQGREWIVLTYRNADGEGQRNITEEEYETFLWERHSDIIPMRLNFIPIEQ